MGGPIKRTFRSLRSFNYRAWAGGALVSNIGTWMQRTAQDWLVLTELTHRSETAVGIVTGLQPILPYPANRSLIGGRVTA